MAFAPRFRMGPPPRSFAADAHDCIVVSSLGSAEYKFVARTRARWRAPLGIVAVVDLNERGHGARVVPSERAWRCARSRQGQVAARWPPATLDRNRPIQVQGRRARLQGSHREGPRSGRRPPFHCEPELGFSARSTYSSESQQAFEAAPAAASRRLRGMGTRSIDSGDASRPFAGLFPRDRYAIVGRCDRSVRWPRWRNFPSSSASSATPARTTKRSEARSGR